MSHAVASIKHLDQPFQQYNVNTQSDLIKELYSEFIISLKNRTVLVGPVFHAYSYVEEQNIGTNKKPIKVTKNYNVITYVAKTTKFE